MFATRVVSGRAEAGAGRPARRIFRARDLSAVRPLTVQRTALRDRDGPEPTGPLDPELAARIAAARGGGKALPPATRAPMERFFERDFSAVRVHDDAASRELGASLRARAFTLGGDIFLGPGASLADAPLIRHELTHVVQQRETRGSGPLTLGAPDTAPEREADANAARPAPDASGALAPPAPAEQPRALVGGATVQRFEQGELGHGGIEERGLTKAGFTGDMGSGEIGAIYFGNWMRDWSQVPPGATSPVLNALVFKLLNILSWGEFNRPLDPAKLGGYLPSEHMDNPLGGKTVEAAGTTHAAGDVSQRDFDKSYGALSERQKADFAKEVSPDSQAAVAAASRASGLPDYIERSKAHVRAKLAESVQQGRTPDGLASFGDAMHAVEDYYAHSNFTELALALLAHDNPAARKVLAEAKREGFDATSAETVGADPLKRGAAVITGTVGDEAHNANAKVALIEALRAEIATGSLRRAFLLGLFRTGGTGLLGGALGVLGGIAGGVVGAITGFARDVGAAVGRLFGRHDDQKFGSRTKSGLASGIAIGGNVGRTVGNAIEGTAAAAVAGAVLLTLVTPILAILKASIGRPSVSARLTRESAVGAPGGKPTHSQISKDAPDHPVHKAAAALAEHADEVFGRAMIAAWSNPDKAAATASVVPLVDRFVAYPTENRPVWQPALEAVLAASTRPK
jgi:Domain of unknown function (DUF4157)/Heterokaryon incompatibility protein Het-C